MATSMFEKVEDKGGILRDRITLAWREISRNNQYDAEDKILKILDKSPLSKPEFDVEHKKAIVKIARKMSNIIFSVLKNKRKYEPYNWEI